MLGATLYQQKEFGAAEQAVRQASILYPRYEEAYDLLATLAERQGNVPQALAAYRQVLTVNPKNLEARLRLGILLEKTNQLAEARQAYQEDHCPAAAVCRSAASPGHSGRASEATPGSAHCLSGHRGAATRQC